MTRACVPPKVNNLIQNKEIDMAHLEARIAELEKDGKRENIDFRIVYFSDTAELKILG